MYLFICHTLFNIYLGNTLLKLVLKHSLFTELLPIIHLYTSQMAKTSLLQLYTCPSNHLMAVVRTIDFSLTFKEKLNQIHHAV